MKNWIRSTITLAFVTAIVFVSVGSKVHGDPKCRDEWKSVLSKADKNLSAIEFEKEAESIIEPKMNLFITGGSLKALLQ